MPAALLTDFSRLCLHTITTKSWSLDQACDHYTRAGVKGISIWRDAFTGRDPAKAGQQLCDAGLSIVSLVRGGFFTSKDAPSRQNAIEENLRCVDEAAALGAPIVVLVCGAVTGQSLAECVGICPHPGKTFAYARRETAGHLRACNSVLK